MPNAGTAVARATNTETMTKPEVCAYLGKSVRTIVHYVSKGTLPVKYINGRNGQQAMFERADVERLKRELDTPAFRAIQTAPSNVGGLATVNAREAAMIGARRQGTDQASETLAQVLNAMRAPALPKPWLTLSEAAEYSGLPAAWLLAQARAGAIRAMNVGTGAREFWRFNREALAK